MPSSSSFSSIGDSGSEYGTAPMGRQHPSSHGHHHQQHAVLRDKILNQFMTRGNNRRKDLLKEYRRKQQHTAQTSSPIAAVAVAGYPHPQQTIHSNLLPIFLPPQASPTGTNNNNTADAIHQYIQENFLQSAAFPSPNSSSSRPFLSAAANDHTSAFHNTTSSPANRAAFPLPSPTRNVSFSSDIDLHHPSGSVKVKSLVNWDSFVTSGEYEDLYLHIEDSIRKEAELGLDIEGGNYGQDEEDALLQADGHRLANNSTPWRSVATPSPYARSQSYSPFERGSFISSNVSIEATCDLNESMGDWEAGYGVDDPDYSEEVLVCPFCWRDSMQPLRTAISIASVSPFSAHSGSAAGYCSAAGQDDNGDDDADTMTDDVVPHVLSCSCGAVIDLGEALTPADFRHLLSDIFDRHNTFCVAASNSSSTAMDDGEDGEEGPSSSGGVHFRCQVVGQALYACCNKCGFAEQVL